MVYRQPPEALTLRVRHEEGRLAFLYVSNLCLCFVLTLGVGALFGRWGDLAGLCAGLVALVPLASFSLPAITNRAYTRAGAKRPVRIEAARIEVPVADDVWSFDRADTELEARSYFERKLVAGRAQTRQGVYIEVRGGGRRVHIEAPGDTAPSWGFVHQRGDIATPDAIVYVWARELLPVALALGLCERAGEAPRVVTPWTVARIILLTYAVVAGTLALLLGGLALIG